MWWKKWKRRRLKSSDAVPAKGIAGKDFRTQRLRRDLTFNKEMLQHILGNSLDVVFRDITLSQHGPNAIILYLDNMVDGHEVNENLLKSIMLESPPIPEEDAFDVVRHTALTIGEVYVAKDFGKLVDGVIFGDTAIVIDGFDTAIICGTKGFKSRAIGEANAEIVVRGPKEAFTEILINNVTQLRRRVRTPYLRFEVLSVGRLTRTDIALGYIEGVVDPEVLKEVRRRIKRIDTDSILESGYIEEYIEDHPYSPFPQIEHTERPDKVAASLVEGRVAIMIDGTPFVLLAPTLLLQFLQASEDYYEKYYYGTVIRWLRLAAMILSLTLPAIYVAVITYHQGMIPTPLALSIAAGREGVPLPAIMEALLMEITFELFREAGIRLPRAVGQAVSIVGALIIGEAAVQAGLISPIMIIIVATTGIASFAIPSYNLTIAFRLLRFPIILLAGLFGFPGLFSGLAFILAHVASLKSFGVPYLTGTSVFGKYGRDALVRAPHWAQLLRPRSIGRMAPIRQKKR